MPADDCGSCRFYEFEGTILAMEPAGFCRRRSPDAKGWPQVLERDWCGQFEVHREVAMDRRDAAEERLGDRNREAAYAAALGPDPWSFGPDVDEPF